MNVGRKSSWLLGAFLCALLAGCAASLDTPPLCLATPPGSSLPFSAGSGVPSDPYIICTADQLAVIGTDSSYLTMSFALGANIDLSAYDNSSAATTFTPIGYYDSTVSQRHYFSGTFDGGGYTISNLTMSRPSSAARVGFFTGVQGGSITNLNLDKFIVAGYNSTGALVGELYGGTLSNIAITNTQVQYLGNGTGSGALGGVIGGIKVDSSSPIATVQNVSANSMSLFGFDPIGGIAGTLYAVCSSCKVNLDTVTFSGTIGQASGVYGNSQGGFVGYLNLTNGGQATFSRVSTAGSLTTTGSWGAALLANIYLQSGSSLKVTQSYSTMNVTATGAFGATNGLFGGNCVGGFAGSLNASNATISVSNSHWSGNLAHSSPYAATGIGGFIGCYQASNGGQQTITQSYSEGSVTVSTAESKVGGFMGYSSIDGLSTGTISNSYSTASVSAPLSSRVGGFAGEGANSTLHLTNDYAIGLPTGASTVGGFIGGTGSTNNGCYWNTDIKATGFGAATTGVNGATTTQMETRSTYSGWDFSTIWTNVDGSTYPTLR